jgi:methylase of polypeptide subunit release factors
LTAMGDSVSADAAATSAALLALLNHLRDAAYEFTTVTPQTHARVMANRRGRSAASLRDIFGWSMPFQAGLLPRQLLSLLREARVVTQAGDEMRSAVRVATLEDDLFVHSAFPAATGDAVFFGPDTCRFYNLIRDNLPAAAAGSPLRIADIGCGSGAGGIMAARLRVGARVILNDINPHALVYAGANAACANVEVELALGDAFSAVEGDFDVVLCNPPYLMNDEERACLHGGDAPGRARGVAIASQALERLQPGGRLILYTGVAIVNGVNHFVGDLEPHLGRAGCTYTYAEIDPDVFGEELERPAYREAERIAAVGLVAIKA